jgi:hypothetical protein
MSQKLRARDSKTSHLSPSTIISILEQGYSRLIIILKHHKPPLVGEHQNKGGANHLLQRFDVNSHQERRCQLPMTQSPSSSAANNSIKKKHAIRYLALKIKSQNRTNRHSSHRTLRLLGNSHLCQEEVGDELLSSQVPSAARAAALVIEVSGDTNVAETVSAAAEERIPYGLETNRAHQMFVHVGPAGIQVVTVPRWRPGPHLMLLLQTPLLTPWPLTCMLKSSQLCSGVLFLNSEAPQKCTKLRRLVLQ